jgi:Flp pilus assembly pilin Flp
VFIKQQVAIQNFATELVARVRDEERGQTFVEWLGVMAIVVAIVGALTASGVLDPVKTAIVETASKAVKTIGNKIT